MDTHFYYFVLGAQQFDTFGTWKHLHLPLDTGHLDPSKKHIASPVSLILHEHFLPGAAVETYAANAIAAPIRTGENQVVLEI